MRTTRVLQPVRPRMDIEQAYRRRLEKMIDDMHRSVTYWLRAAYRRNEPVMATDELPARTLTTAMRRLARYWQKKFDEMAPDLAAYFAQTAAQRADAALQSILRRGGMSVRFKMGRGAQDVIRAAIEENVGLIRSIPQQHFGRIEGMVLRSVQTGRDLKQLTDDLEQAFGVTRRRAAFIARDQNNKASAVIQRVRQAEVGIREAVWVHSGGGKHPRPTHLKAGRDRVKYDVDQGWWDPAIKKYIWPGTEPNCRCVSRSVVAGFTG